jgi:hypothetical protein
LFYSLCVRSFSEEAAYFFLEDRPV